MFFNYFYLPNFNSKLIRMEQQKYKYDIAISFANEDLKIAKKIAKQLKRLGITYYLYSEEVTLSSNLTATTWNVYYQDSRFALVLISKYYKDKKWSSREWDAIYAVHRPYNRSYMILIRIDDTQEQGLHPDTIFLEWKKNASHIAISLYELISLKSVKKKIKAKKKIKTKNKEKPKIEPRSHTIDLRRSTTNSNTILNGDGNINSSKKD